MTAKILSNERTKANHDSRTSILRFDSTLAAAAARRRGDGGIKRGLRPPVC